ncbi:signal-regulatory protein beta-1-like isoform X2 [Mauremys reevesii]|uniref:signal-regulatory protein beta-1-like isoform X2 n=1 Tax=Mauremys reevesii TaxID=260615 RepID=UPI00193EE4EF|nr:signal-regulatory protein beta-1-like isoform X2 [Mauremys reevesii]
MQRVISREHRQAQGAGAQKFQLLQPQSNVSVPVGETLTLSCSVTGLAPPGPMKWFKGSGSGRQLVYDQTGSFLRVTRAVSGSSTDFTIHISDTRPEDAGIYHCVKFQEGSGPDEEFRSGAGTAVTVSGRWPLASPALWIGLFLEKVLIAAFLLFSFFSTMGTGPRAVSWFSRTVAACQGLRLRLCPCRPGNESTTDAAAVSPAGRAEGAQA